MLRRRRRREAGVLLGVVLILLVVVLLGGALALWSVRSDTASSGNDRQARLLLDCAEQGLEWGKQYFSTTATSWQPYLNANNVCSTAALAPACVPNGPLYSGTGTPQTNYPFSQTINTTGSNGVMGTTANPLTWTVALFRWPTSGSGMVTTPSTNLELVGEPSDRSVAIYSRCVDQNGQARSATAVIKTVTPTNNDYLGQAGMGMRNQGNMNSVAQ